MAPYPFQYVRLLPDCLLPTEQLKKELKKLEKIAIKAGAPFFRQYKIHDVPDKCYLRYFHPVMYTDEYIYPCDSLVLNDEANKQFNYDYRLCHYRDLPAMYENPVSSEFDPHKMCNGCVFKRQNDLLIDIKTPILHKEFI